MSEYEEMMLFEKISEGIKEAQRRLFKRKAKLGENVIIADAEGCPIEVPASDLLHKINCP